MRWGLTTNSRQEKICPEKVAAGRGPVSRLSRGLCGGPGLLPTRGPLDKISKRGYVFDSIT